MLNENKIYVVNGCVNHSKERMIQMRKTCLFVSLVIAFVSVFSIGTFAAETQPTKTETFFSTLETNQIMQYVNPGKNDEMGPLKIKDMSIRLIKDDEGKEIAEWVGTVGLWIWEAKMYIIEDGCFYYFPQFNKHMDLSFLIDEEVKETTEFVSSQTDSLLGQPCYQEYMTFVSASEENIKGIGKVYKETFSYDAEAILNDLIANDLIERPNYNINYSDNESIADYIYWNGGCYNPKTDEFDGELYYVSELLEKNEVIFYFNENGDMLACDYYTGEGTEMENVYYELGFADYITLDVPTDEFIVPDSSSSLAVFELFAKIVFAFLF